MTFAAYADANAVRGELPDRDPASLRGGESSCAECSVENAGRAAGTGEAVFDGVVGIGRAPDRSVALRAGSHMTLLALQVSGNINAKYP